MATRGLIYFYRPPRQAEQDSMRPGTPPGVSFGEFQKRSVSWASNKFGERFGKELKGKEVLDIDQLDFEDDSDLDKFEEYGRKVYETMSIDSFKWAESLVGSLKEKAWSFQKDLNNKYREWTFCLLYKMVYDNARRKKGKNVGEGVLDPSQAFFVRLNAGHPEAARTGEEKERLLMPNSSGNKFPMLLREMENKQEEFEAEREWILDMCPKGDESTYENGKETFLVRMMVDFLLKENDTAVQELLVRSLKRAHTAGEAVTRTVISPLEDYSKEVVLQKPIQERPSLKGQNERRCYGCGCLGRHLRGDPECSAVEKAVWMGAPERFKRKVEEGDQPLFDGGERKEGSNRQKLWKGPRRTEVPKLPCRN
jgi:hypothetical protein